MKRLNDVIEQFLKTDESTRLGPHLGGAPRTVTEQQISFFIEQLKASAAFNRKVVAVLVGLYVLMMIIGFIIVLTLFKQPQTMRVALGGSFLSLLLILKGLQSVWREQQGISFMTSLLPSLSPAEAMKVVETHYYKTKLQTTQPRE
jgi:hypothetical protein